MITLVDGPSGSGKSDYGVWLAAERNAVLVSLDDVYPGWDGLDAGSWHIHRNVLLPISQGLPGRYQRWDWRLGVPAEWVDVSSSRPVVIEGCGAIRREGLAIRADRVWVGAASDVRKRRALERDGDMYAPHWQRWALQEERFLALHDGPANADLTVTTG
jgi:cytidylate kinase